MKLRANNNENIVSGGSLKKCGQSSAFLSLGVQYQRSSTRKSDIKINEYCECVYLIYIYNLNN